MKRAAAYLRKEKMFIDSYSKTTTGIWIGVGPVHVIAENQIAALTEAIRSALNNSKLGVPHPEQDEWKNIQQPMLEAAGVKSWTTFAKGAKSVGIKCEGTVVTMEPTANYENKGGEGLPEKTVQCDLNDDKLSDYLIRAFAACE